MTIRRSSKHEGGLVPKEPGLRRLWASLRKRTWKHFLNSHWDTLYACDFFSVEVLGVFGTVRHMVFFVMEVNSRAAQIDPHMPPRPSRAIGASITG